MNLLQYEIKKLLFNKRSMIFIAILALLYISVGVGNSLFTFQENSSFSEYSEIASDVEGSINQEFAATSTEKIQDLLSIYGSTHSVKRVCSRDSELKLFFDYAQYADRVNSYTNGNSESDEPTGIVELEQELEQLKDNGKTDTYQYKKLNKQLTTMKKLGAPEFHNVVLWQSLFEGWNGLILLILLFFPMAFLISSVYTKESTTGMDNLILSSEKGRTSIALAKLGAVAISTVFVTLIYFIATFIGNFLPFMSLKGGTVSVRSLGIMSNAQFDMSIFSFALITVLWVTFISIVFGAIIAYISSKFKNQASVFGVGIIILLLGIILEALGSNIVSKLQIIVDFCFDKVLNVSTILGSATTYNLFGFVVPYYILATIIFVLLGVFAILLVIRQQKHRTIA